MPRNYREKEKERFYLLPGQGGKMYRRKQKIILLWSVIAALTVALVLSVAMYFMNRSNTFLNP
jgi:hypothetical protein